MLTVLITIGTVGLSMAQEKDPAAGELQLGMRSTFSLFGNDGYPGTGVGGQFRLRLGKQLNTEWFADFITTDLGGMGQRVDGHIGWSVMFYPLPNTEAPLVPYILAGHCFDHTRVTIFDPEGDISRRRLSSAVQLGLGNHFKISERFDVSLSGQYMIHLGNDIHTGIETIDGVEQLHFHEDDQSGIGLEGHVLVTVSVNYKLADLW